MYGHIDTYWSGSKQEHLDSDFNLEWTACPDPSVPVLMMSLSVLLFVQIALDLFNYKQGFK